MAAKNAKGKRIKGKRLISFILCLFIIGSMAGCKDPSQGTPGGEAPAVISVWYSMGGQNEQELLRQFDRINREHPEVIVKGEKVPEEKFMEQVWNYQAGGEGPEILITGRQILFSLYEKGAISPVLAENYHAYPSTKAVFTLNNQQIAAPWMVDIPLLYYRKDKVPEGPANLVSILDKKNPIAAKAFQPALFSPWWLAEGGSLSLNGLPTLDSQANLTFLNKILTLKSAGLLIFDNQGLEKFKKGEVGYFLSWASDRATLTQAGINWGSSSLVSQFGGAGKVFLDKSIGIANSSIKSIPTMEKAIRLVQEELLKEDTESFMEKAGGNLPASDLYYEGAQPGSFQAQAATTLKSAYELEGYMLDWKFLSLQDQAWKKVLEGTKPESALQAVQQSALGMVTER